MIKTSIGKKLDFGSGYQPVPGFFLCDLDGWALDYRFDPVNYRILGCPDHTFDVIHTRNCVHHVPDIDKLAAEFHRVLKPSGFLLIVDCNEQHFPANVFLDYFWTYGIRRYANPWFSHGYRDYISVFKKRFKLLRYSKKHEKEYSVFSPQSCVIL